MTWVRGEGNPVKTSQALLAEAIGTFFLCFAGIAAILSTQSPLESDAGIFGIALAHGLALSIAVNAFGLSSFDSRKSQPWVDCW